MFLDRLEDAGITVNGDDSKVDSRVQGIADAVLPLLPKMGAPMHVSVYDGGLALSWHARRSSFVVRISSKLVVSVIATREGAGSSTYAGQNGESSALATWIAKGLSDYIR